jgi:sugar/nucleoside kinase (ribokinase family)
VAEIDVVGIGNALVDVLSQEGEAFLPAQGLTKGAMQLVDEARARELYAAMGPAVEVSGGSAANTIVGVASFGGRAHYVGKVRDDQLGEVFSHDLRSIGVGYSTPAATEGPRPGSDRATSTRASSSGPVSSIWRATSSIRPRPSARSMPRPTSPMRSAARWR